MRTRDKQMLERNVARGVAYLDANPDKEEAFQEWYRKIDLSILDMSTGFYCIIGQTLGNYSNLIDVDDFATKPNGWLTRWAVRHGFLSPDRKRNKDRYWMMGEWFCPTDSQWRDESYRYLGALWRQEVMSRQLDSSILLQAAL